MSDERHTSRDAPTRTASRTRPTRSCPRASCWAWPGAHVRARPDQFGPGGGRVRLGGAGVPARQGCRGQDLAAAPAATTDQPGEGGRAARRPRANAAGAGPDAVRLRPGGHRGQPGRAPRHQLGSPGTPWSPKRSGSPGRPGRSASRGRRGAAIVHARDANGLLTAGLLTAGLLPVDGDAARLRRRVELGLADLVEHFDAHPDSWPLTVPPAQVAVAALDALPSQIWSSRRSRCTPTPAPRMPSRRPGAPMLEKLPRCSTGSAAAARRPAVRTVAAVGAGT